jgi:hypothetical protein
MDPGSLGQERFGSSWLSIGSACTVGLVVGIAPGEHCWEPRFNLYA